MNFHTDHEHKEPELREIVRYFDYFVLVCKELALELNLSRQKVNAIFSDTTISKERLYGIFNTYLMITPSPCWCDIILALRRIGLLPVADMIEEKFLGNYYSMYVLSWILAGTNNLIFSEVKIISSN